MCGELAWRQVLHGCPLCQQPRSSLLRLAQPSFALMPVQAIADVSHASGGPLAQGSVGAGTGATIGKLFDPTHATKGGLGSASMKLAYDTLSERSWWSMRWETSSIQRPGNSSQVSSILSRKSPRSPIPLAIARVPWEPRTPHIVKEWTNKIAQMAFLVSIIGAAAANTLARAVVKAVRSATALHGWHAVEQKERGTR